MPELAEAGRRTAIPRAATLSGCTARRAALTLFVVVEAVAVPLMLAWGRRSWFTADDWDFLTARSVGSPHALLLPHFNHWTTLPIIAYRGIWQLFGLRYLPYQLLLILLHLAVAALLRIIMRRAGVGPWLATIVAAIFVFFGYGAENVLVAFQMTFVGAVVFGLSHLVLVDHDGPVDRRDALGLCAGVAGLLCSGVAVTMVAVVGIATLWRRGWRIALVHVAPLASLYVLWFALIGHTKAPGSIPSATARTVIGFVIVGIEATFENLAPVPVLGGLVFATVVVGLALRRRKLDRLIFAQRTAAPVALLVGAVVFLFLTGIGRSNLPNVQFFGVNTHGGVAHARESRYVYIVAAMMLPALAIAAQMLAHTWRRIGILFVALLILAIPVNIRRFSQFGDKHARIEAATRRVLETAPRLSIAQQLPRSLRPDPIFAVTIGWLLDALHQGRLPAPGRISAADASTVTLQVVLQPVAANSRTPCKSLTLPLERVMEEGENFVDRGGLLAVTYLPNGGAQSRPVYVPRSSARTVIFGPLPLRFSAIPPGPATLCAWRKPTG